MNTQALIKKKMAKDDSSEEINYIDAVKQKRMEWNIFIDLMQDLCKNQMLNWMKKQWKKYQLFIRFMESKITNVNLVVNVFTHLKDYTHTVHEGSKDYKCDSCGKSFSKIYKLKTHHHTVHSLCSQ